MLNNVSTVLLMVPVTLAIVEELEVAAVSVLVRGSVCFEHRRHGDADRRPAGHSHRHAGGLDFNDFIVNVAPVTVLVMAVQAAMVHSHLGPRPSRQPESRVLVMGMNARD